MEMKAGSEEDCLGNRLGCCIRWQWPRFFHNKIWLNIGCTVSYILGNIQLAILSQKAAQTVQQNLKAYVILYII